MKFGKLLQTTAADMPEMNQLFLRYKQLKKQLKGLPNQPDLPAADGASAGPSAAAACVATGTSQHAVGNAIPQPVAAEGPAGAGVDGCSSSGRLSPEEQHFIQTLNEDLARFNDFFMEREEEAVIKLQARSFLCPVRAGFVVPREHHQRSCPCSARRNVHLRNRLRVCF